MALFGGILEHFAEEEELLCYCLCRDVEMPATKWGKVYSKWMEVVWKCENLHMFYVFVLCCNSLYPLDIIYLMVLHFYAILIEIHSKRGVERLLEGNFAYLVESVWSLLWVCLTMYGLGTNRIPAGSINLFPQVVLAQQTFFGFCFQLVLFRERGAES